MKTWIKQIVLCLSVILFICACSTTAKIWKPYDNITITAGASVNQDANKRASPVQIKIYSLSSRSTFDNLDFDRAFYNAKTLLSDELLSEAEYTVQPSETAEHTVNLTKNTHFIAILAGFIDIDNARWKHVYKVKPHGHYNHSITINENSIIEGKPSITKESIEENVKKGSESIDQANQTKQSIKSLLGK